MGSINGKHTQYESEMKKTIAILGSALLLAAFPAQAQQPQSGSAAQDTEQAAPLSREELMRIAIRLSEENVAAGGGPFGAVIARDGRVVATGANRVTPDCDPTAHAEVSAIRAAAKKLGTFDLSGCEIYTSCEPCPMCLSAIYWAGIRKIYFANTREDAKRIGFDDSFIYDQIPLAPSQRTVPSEEMMRAEALQAFRLWERKEDKVEY